MNPTRILLLLVEDNPGDTRLIKEMLRGAPGVELVCADRLSTGLEQLASGDINAVLLDPGLPDSQGLATLIQVHTHYPKVPIVVLTGCDNDVIAVEAVKAGAQDYMVKGQVNPIMLQHSIRYAIDRKKAEEALLASQQRFKELTDSIADVFFAMDKDLRYTYWNKASEKLTGISAEEAVGRSLYDVFPDMPGSKAEELYLETLRTRKFKTEINHYKLHGKEYIFELSAYPSGNGLAVLARDVTERERTEEALQKSESMYKSLIENMGDVVFTIDLVGRVTFASRSIETILGYKSEEVINKNIIDFVPPEDMQRAIETIPKGMKGEKITQYQTQAITKSGDRVFLELAFSRIYKDGAVVGAQAIAKDITERDRAEEALLASQQRFKELTDSIADVFFAMDKDLRYTYWNKASEELTGISAKEAVGKSLYDVFPDVRGSKAEELYLETLRTRKFKTEINHYKIHGKEYVFELSAYPSGNGLAVLARDVTEIKRTEEQLREKEEQFRQAQKMEAIGRLAGGVAHDFNNILATIIVYSDLLLHDLKEGDPLRGDIGEIRKAADRAASLTRQLLAFSRRQVLEPRVLDLNKIVYSMEPMLQRLIGEDVELVTALSPDLGSVRADSGQIEQVIMNLVVNSRDAMPGGGRLIIETSNVCLDDAYTHEHMSVTPGPYVMLALTDTGCGMDEDTRSKVFEPFFTTKERGKGTGLGLSTVYGIVKQSGGNIWVYSEPGKGTTFKIYLPQVEEDIEDVAPARVVAESPGGSETVLVVEDDDALRRLILRILKNNGYNVLEARHGNDALLIYEGYKGVIDLLITDVIMPHMGGRELVKHLALLCPGLKVLYMSGYTDEAIVLTGILEPDAPFIQKPFTSNSLLIKVREVLDSSKTNTECSVSAHN